MKAVYIAIAFAAVAFASEKFDFEETELVQISDEENLLSVVHDMRGVAPKHLQEHIKVVAHHAELLQDEKAKAYAHNFSESQAAIRAAIKSLNDELKAGHDHDVAALASAKASGNKVVSEADAAAKSRVRAYRDRACPTKRAEEAANAKKGAAKKKMDGIADGNICELSTTWGDMDIDKSVAKYGTALRNKWDTVRSKFVKAREEHALASKDHADAVSDHERSMAGFTTALGIESQNVVDSCNAAHKEYNNLCKDIQSNVRTRKQTYIAGLVIQCYVDNITSNAGAKTCADKARTADTKKWDINCGSLTACASKAANSNRYGPADWVATSANCKGHKASTTHTKCADKGYSHTFNTVLNSNEKHIAAQSGFKSLNKDFILKVTAKATNDAYPRSYVPLYFESNPLNGKTNRGLSIGHGKSSGSVEVRMADNSKLAVHKFSFPAQKLNVENEYELKCNYVAGEGRMCSLQVNGATASPKQQMFAVKNNIYDTKAKAVFGNVYGWKFIGTFKSLSVSPGNCKSVGHHAHENHTKIKVSSAGYTKGNYGRIYVDGNNVNGRGGRGFNVVTIDPAKTGAAAVTHKKTYDTHGNHHAGAHMLSFINGLPHGTIVAVAVMDEAAARGSKGLEALRKCGGKITSLAYRGSLAFIGRKGAKAGTAWELKNDPGHPQHVEHSVDTILKRVK
jgi:hypothetical protein